MTKENPGLYDCYAKAAPDEPLFTLRAKDPAGEYLVAAWVALRAGDVDAAKRLMEEAAAVWAASGRTLLPYDNPKSIDAQQCARHMRTWRIQSQHLEDLTAP